MKKGNKIKTYTELSRIKSFIDRLEYLKLNGKVAEPTFGDNRYLNQLLYSSDRWKKIRGMVIVRDNGCDLGVDGLDVLSRIYVHHINPLSVEDIEYERSCVFDMDNLICCSLDTHNRIHFGMSAEPFAIRKPNDTCPWKEGGLHEYDRTRNNQEHAWNRCNVYGF